MLLDRIMSRLGIVSFKGRLRLYFISLAIFFIIIAAIPFNVIGKDQLRKNAVDSLDQMMNIQQVIIDTWLEEKQSDIKAIAELPGIRGDDVTKFAEVLASFDKNHPYFDEVLYVNGQGLIELGNDEFKNIDVSDRNYFEKAKEGKPYITDVLFGKHFQQPVVIVSFPVYDYGNSFKGVVLGIIPITVIDVVLSEYESEDREMFLVNRDGMIFTNTEQGSIGETIHTEIINNAFIGERITHFYENNIGSKVVGDYRYIHDDQWLIIGEVKEEVIYQPFNQVVATISVIFLLLLIAGFYISFQVSNRVELIQDVLVGTKIGQENWTYRIKKPHDGETVEFKELRKNFNHMAQLIENYINSLAKSEERFRLITEYSSDMITIHDINGKYLYMSPAGKEILQYDYDEVVGKDYAYFIHPDDKETLQVKHEELLKAGEAVRTYRIRRKDGEYIWLESSITFLKESKAEKQIIVISRNITERKETEQSLKEANELLMQLSTRDGLTGAWNRRMFDQQLTKEWNRALKGENPPSLLMIDNDFFKEFNDTYGHQEGDKCLQKVTTQIRETVKQPGDMVYRYGGEEFSVILPETDKNDARIIAESIRESIENLGISHESSKSSDVITVSIGIATLVPKYGMEVEELIEIADNALYKAKSGKRNQVIM